MSKDNVCTTCDTPIAQTEILGVDGDEVYCQLHVTRDMHTIFPIDLGDTIAFHIMEPNSTVN